MEGIFLCWIKYAEKNIKKKENHLLHNIYPLVDNIYFFYLLSGEYIPENYLNEKNIEGAYFKLKDSLEEDLKNADLVISHCGKIKY